MSRPVLVFSLLIPSGVMGQVPPPDDRTSMLVENARQMVAVDADGCLLRQANDDILVCGTSDIDRQQRLPFPELAARPGERIRELLPKGNPEIVQQGRCHVTMDERNCFKGLQILSVGFGGPIGGAAGRLWQTIAPVIPPEDYVEQAMIKPLSPAPTD